MNTILLGLGNPILGDDGVGWKVIEQFRQDVDNRKHQPPWIMKPDSDCLSEGGLNLMERLIGYERAIIVDAIQTGQNPPGTVLRFSLEELPERSSGHTASAHDTNLQTALEAGRSLGAVLPQEVIIIGIEAEKVYDFSEELTPPVAAAIPKAVQMVCSEISI